MPGRRLRLDGVPDRIGQGQDFPAGAAQARQEQEGQGRQGELGLFRPDPPLHAPAWCSAATTAARRKAPLASSPIDAPVSLPYDKPVATLEAGRHLRRNDLHEQLPALGHGAGRGRLRRAGDAPQRAVHSAAQQEIAAMARGTLPHPLDRPASARRQHLCQPVHGGQGVQRFRQLPQAARRAEAVHAGRADLPPRRPGRQLLPGARRLRQGVAAAARRRTGPQVHRARRPFRRDRPAVASARGARAWPRPGVRTATCTALDHVDLVQIRGDDFLAIVDRFPQLREHFVKMGVEALQARRTSPQGGGKRAAGRLPQAGPDERPESAGARPGEMHPLRRMHEGLCRFS